MFTWRLALLICLFGLVIIQISADGECGGKTCLEDEASCIDDECVCDEEPSGDGTLACYGTNEFGAHVVNDPTLMTFNKNRIRLPVPCRYKFTHVETQLKDRSGGLVGICKIKMHVFHGKNKGKIFVHGYDLAISVIFDNGTTLEVSFRLYGWAYGGVYTYKVNATWGDFLPDGPWGDDTVDYDDGQNSGVKLILERDDDENLMRFEVKKCGWRSYFRPYDKLLRLLQPWTPGAAVAINCAFHPKFLWKEAVMALPPVDSHHGFDIDSILLPGLNRVETFVNRAFTVDIVQNQPNAGVECANAKDHLNNCDDGNRPSAYHACLWILESPRFIRCFNPGPTCDAIVGLFNACVDVFCWTADCPTFQASLAGDFNCDETTGYSELDAWVAGDYC